MRRLSVLLALVTAIAAVALAQPAPSRPRLVVVIVLDQFRPEYLTTFSAHWRRGFKTLLAEGANFRHAQYPYFYTDTCAGHFTIGTGTLPRTHGMVNDDWYERDTRRQVECTADEGAPAISYGAESKLTNSSRNLKVPTLADRLRERDRATRVVTVSLKARGAIGLAGHKGDAVTWFDEAANTFLTSRAFANAPVDAVKRFVDSHPYQQDLGKTWTLRDPATLYHNRDAGVGERPPAGWNGLFPHVLKGVNGADAQYARQWQRSGYSDAYLGRFAVDLAAAFNLGRRDVTDFLGISFSGPDRVGHLFGPYSREYEDIAARMDDVLGDLITTLDARVGRRNYVLALAADHGVAPVPGVDGAGRVMGEDVRERIEEILTSRYGASADGGHVEWYATGGVYLRQATRIRLAADPATVRAVQAGIEEIPGVQRLLYAPALSVDSKDPLVRMGALSGNPERIGDFIVAPARNWIASTRASTDAASHNGPYEYNQRVPLLLFGGAIKAGTYDAPVSPADIAPTLAAVAGTPMPGVEGRVLAEALTQPVNTSR
jgi:predicted AlkP superfamily pyrophosphatase or phosphodiesterase